jgi:hypothetical protein
MDTPTPEKSPANKLRASKATREWDLSRDQKRQLLSDSIRQLAGHPPFLSFLDAILELRESAVRDACRVDTVAQSGAVLAALGEIRAYEDIIAIVSEHIRETD